LTLSWNILDFGLSYIRAKQSADFVLIQEEARRRTLNRIVEDARSAFWRAIASERLLTRLKALEAKTRRVLMDSRALADGRQTSPIAALTYEREVLEIRREAQRIEGELRVARSQLAALMNLPPNSNFRLTARASGMGPLPAFNDWHGMVRTALVNRPEIREVAYRRRINNGDLDAALVEMLPSLNPFIGGFADSNSLLYNSNWVGYGAKVSWNLLSVFKYPAKQELLENQDLLLDQRSLAVTMAIMTQLKVSSVRYAQAKREFETAARIRRIQNDLLRHIRAAAVTDRTSEQSLIREEMNSILSDVRADLAYANLQNAYGNVYASLGLDVYPPVDIEHSSVSQIASALRVSWIGRGMTRVNVRGNIRASHVSGTVAAGAAQTEGVNP
jgi:outer membrane protein TolC